jgi:DNA-3-methyladenine glycosylase II
LSEHFAPGDHEALAASDPRMAAIMEQVDVEALERRMSERSTDRFQALARIIVGQQVSTAAARTVWGRIVEAFDGDPSADALAAPGTEEKLRVAGLSGRKASYMIGLAETVAAGELRLDELDDLGDHEVIEALVAVRGLGRWSAEMFLLFDLARPDVFSGGDLGLREGVRVAYGLAEPPTPEDAVAIAERWSPHRSLACLYLWEAIHADLPVAALEVEA